MTGFSFEEVVLMSVANPAVPPVAASGTLLAAKGLKAPRFRLDRRQIQLWGHGVLAGHSGKR